MSIMVERTLSLARKGVRPCGDFTYDLECHCRWFRKFARRCANVGTQRAARFLSAERATVPQRPHGNATCCKRRQCIRRTQHVAYCVAAAA